MRARDFCYWVQGFFEISESGGKPKFEALNPHQVACIRRHLDMVFKHEIDPSHGDAAHQKILSAIHVGSAGAGGTTPKLEGVGDKPGSCPFCDVAVLNC